MNNSLISKIYFTQCLFLSKISRKVKEKKKAVSRNVNLFLHERLTKLLHRTLKCTFRKEKFLRKKNEKFKGREFLELFVETYRINFHLY